MNKENTKWESSPSRSHIMEKEVHLWRAILDPTDGSAQPFKQMLSPAELRRANKFLTPETRNRFIITRGMLRFLLGRYLSVSPRRIEFQLGKQGKPKMA